MIWLNAIKSFSDFLLPYLIVFVISGLFYFVFESIINWLVYRKWIAEKLEKPEWSGFSMCSLWMIPVAGILGIVIDIIYQIQPIQKYAPMLALAIIGCILVTAIELGSGMILNIKLKLAVWDYSRFSVKIKGKEVPVNFKGQICLWHSLGWLALSPFIFWIDNIIRYFISGVGVLVNPLMFYVRLFSDFFMYFN